MCNFKQLKMKKLIFGFVAVIMFGNLSYGQDFSKVLKDNQFIDYIKDCSIEQNRTKDFIKLKQYITDNKIDEKEFEDLYLALGYKTQDEFKENLALQSNRILNLEQSYSLSSFSDEQMVSLLDQSYTQLKIPISNLPITSYNNCERSFRNCMLIALSTAVLGHVACGAADVTVILGAICHAAVLTMQYAMQDNCGVEYEECTN